jgi:tetratricopeptide (TPR) repeat protein
MKVVAFLLALSLGALWRGTNSHATSRRGAKAYEGKQYAQAVDAYRKAHELAPSPESAFNLGTAEIAAGRREQGSATLAEAIEDPTLRADALFNRANSALAAKAFDHAVRDYVAALKTNPAHRAAKRNLEIALARRESERRTSEGKRDQRGQSQQQQRPEPSEGQKPQAGQLDLETLLRSVQQQEQDELRRMKGKAGEARVGW